KALEPPRTPARVVLDDVEALNQAAREGRYELTKVSYGAIPYLLDRYRILRSGGALGRGCGPLVVAKPGPQGKAQTLASLSPHARVAIPGPLTTAYLLLRLAHQRPMEAVPMRFDTIVDAVARGDVEAGLIIHESRFTYRNAGLVEVEDLGAWWERETGRPIPLGAILARRDLAPAAVETVERTIARSLDYARANDDAVAPYVREHAFEMDEDVMRAHIALYVNEFSRDLGVEGEAAVETLFERAVAANLVPKSVRAAFE
ncbi:MAG: 1,4-dihydroxy-6-naphthoate synthase, partial [Candidatus Eremiobacteraeota bacterium]|nr:1,4-dihydroxy-6-naphthoate synthase [Candidatus Eremiobacteraeota bacterium]